MCHRLCRGPPFPELRKALAYHFAVEPVEDFQEIVRQIGKGSPCLSGNRAPLGGLAGEAVCEMPDDVVGLLPAAPVNHLEMTIDELAVDGPDAGQADREILKARD